MLIHTDKDINYCTESVSTPHGTQKEIACFSWTTASGVVTPLMFKMLDEDGVIQTFDKIHILHNERKLYAGIVSYEFYCNLLVNGLTLQVTLIYYPETCRWVLVEPNQTDSSDQLPQQ